jgi:hypothetical protein
LGIAVHRPCLFQRHHHRCSLDRFSCVCLMGMLPHPRDYIRRRFADPAITKSFATVFAANDLDEPPQRPIQRQGNRVLTLSSFFARQFAE